MISELERRLSEAFHEDAQHARLVNPEQPAELDSWPLSDTRDRGNRRGWIVAVAAATTLIVVAGVALIQHGRDGAPAPISPSPPPPTAPPTTTPPDPTQLFTDIAPDSTVQLPPAPIDDRIVPAAVWTGTEMIVWGGIGARNASVDDGAAFDLATGTWRVIAPAPIQARSHAALAWTGTEMIVWGGIYRDGTIADGAYNQTELADGAAYNPTTDTWRRLPDAPLGAATPIAVWTGEELVMLGASPLTDADNTDESIPETAVAAYSPAADEWRVLANVPSGGRPPQAVWTGTAILASLTMRDPDQTGDRPSVLARYDLNTDTWHIDAQARDDVLVGVPDANGVWSTVIGLPFETGAPVVVFDGEGKPIGSLPAVPVDRGQFGDQVDADGIWVGGEALFWIRGAEWLFPSQGSAQAWALNPATGIWRRLPEGDLIDQLEGATVAAGDVLLSTWNTGVAFRVPTIPTS